VIAFSFDIPFLRLKFFEEILSPTLSCGDEQNSIVGSQFECGNLIAWHYPVVHRDRNTSLNNDPKRAESTGQSRTIGRHVRLTVYRDVHRNPKLAGRV
jgi:hypothetical protein